MEGYRYVQVREEGRETILTKRRNRFSCEGKEGKRGQVKVRGRKRKHSLKDEKIEIKGKEKRGKGREAKSGNKEEIKGEWKKEKE